MKLSLSIKFVLSNGDGVVFKVYEVGSIIQYDIIIFVQINCYLRKKNPQMEINRGLKNLGMRMDQQQQQYPVSVFPHQQPSCSSSSSFKVECYPNGGILSSSSGSGLGMVNPRGIPDLNVVCAAEETFGMTVDSTRKKIMAAQARKRRMIVINNKKISLADKKKII